MLRGCSMQREIWSATCGEELPEATRKELAACSLTTPSPASPASLLVADLSRFGVNFLLGLSQVAPAGLSFPLGSINLAHPEESCRRPLCHSNQNYRFRQSPSPPPRACLSLSPMFIFLIPGCLVWPGSRSRCFQEAISDSSSPGPSFSCRGDETSVLGLQKPGP